MDFRNEGEDGGEYVPKMSHAKEIQWTDIL